MGSPSHTPKQTGLNPDMVYRPLITPPSDNAYLRIDETEDPKFRFRIWTSWVVRFALVWFTFAVLLVFMIVGRLNRSRFVVPIFVELWFVFFWHIFRSLPTQSSSSKLGYIIPKITVQIGDAACVVGGDSNGRPSRNPYALPAFVDFTFAITLLVFGGLAEHRHYYYHGTGIALSITLGSLMLVVSFLSLFKVFHTACLELSGYKDGTIQPIALHSPTDDMPSRRDPVSVTA